jgi:hypothetical protein
MKAKFFINLIVCEADLTLAHMIIQTTAEFPHTSDKIRLPNTPSGESRIFRTGVGRVVCT